MNKKINDTAIFPIGGGSYESPVTSVIEIESEGAILQASFERYNEENLEW